VSYLFFFFFFFFYIIMSFEQLNPNGEKMS